METLRYRQVRSISLMLCTGLAALCHGQSLFTTTVASGLTHPVAFVQDPLRANVQYIVQQGGLIKIMVNGAVLPMPYLDLTSLVEESTEQGLLGMALPSDPGINPYCYVNFTMQGPIMQVSRFSRSLVDPFQADFSTRLDVMQTVRTQGSHLSGTMQFGPDHMLYLPMGDGGGTGDPPNNGQNPLTLLGKMLRIDPRTDDFPSDNKRNYHIPLDNPFVDGKPVKARPEIWAFGLRNPFKFSFDDPSLLGNGALILGDVGQNNWEEVDYQPAGQGGNNYGWRHYEGFSQYSTTPLAYGPQTPPIYVYNHGIGATVIGGHIYRGFELGPDYYGRYFFADFSFSKLWSMVIKFDPVAGKWRGYDLREHTSELGFGIGNVSSLDTDANGELYLVNYGGWIAKLHRTNTTRLTAYSVQTGKLDSGGLRHAVANDNHPIQFETQTPDDTDVVTTFVAKTNMSNPTTLSFDVVGNDSTSTTGLLRIMLHRWSDDTFVQVRAENLNGTKRRFRVSGLNAADFVRSGDGRIEMRLSVTRTSAVVPHYAVLWDQVMLTAG